MRKLRPLQTVAGEGEGPPGPGEAYPAEDSQLRRDVAIRTLPEGLERDPERAARLAASLTRRRDTGQFISASFARASTSPPRTWTR